MTGAPYGTGSRPTDEAARASSPKASIPSAWTPGPWHVFASGYAADKHHSVEVNAESGLTVAYARKFIEVYADQSDANARLIAAAPELYAALEGIQWKSADRDNMEFAATITYSRMDRIRAALAKVLGEQP